METSCEDAGEKYLFRKEQMKLKNVYICSNCGYQASAWQGKCPSCNEWNTFVEEVLSKKSETSTKKLQAKPVSLSEIEYDDVVHFQSGIPGLDLVLGGGLVKASVILLGGEPGIGKSTLSIQVASAFAKRGYNVLYVSGEESLNQVSLRAKRLNADHPAILLLCETELETILGHIEKGRYQLVIIDSIQVIYSLEIASAPGSVVQVRECANRLTSLAKTVGVSLWITGHVTKDGSLAGPRTLEHLVDVVLFFEGERFGAHRILRGFKNRFGSTNELALFEMTAEGLVDIKNPSEFFIAGYKPQTPGVTIGVVMEGTRPLLVEIQALVGTSSGFGAPYRRVQGIDPNRLALLLAVLEKRCAYRFSDKDVFVNVIGGIRIDDTASDLAVIMALVSALTNKPVGDNLAFFGEIGLTGEVRNVPAERLRIKEAVSMGFHNVICPNKSTVQNIEDGLKLAGLL